MKKRNKKGFTLAELLIVVAIIGVLVAIAIPVFSSKLNAAKLNVDKANLRSAYAEAVVDYMDNNTFDTAEIALGECKFTPSVDSSGNISVKMTAGNQLAADHDDYVNNYNGSAFTKVS